MQRTQATGLAFSSIVDRWSVAGRLIFGVGTLLYVVPGVPVRDFRKPIRPRPIIERLACVFDTG